jgi:hypothetical protein
MVTAETAVVLPIIAAFALAVLWLVSLAVAEIRLVDSARDAARALALGVGESSVRSQILDRAPSGTRLDVVRKGSDVTVEVSLAADAPGWLLVPLPAVSLHAAATTEAEPGVPDGP